MPERGMLALLGFLLFLGSLQGEVTLPGPTRDGMTVQLMVRVADRGDTPGLARVKFVLTVAGPVGIEVESARLIDPGASWTSTRTMTQRFSEVGTIIEESVELQQIRPGLIGLPGVRVRYRANSGSGWQEADWQNILGPREVPPPESVPPLPSPWPWLLTVGVSVVVIFLASLAWWGGRQLLKRPSMEPTPEQRALGELARLERQVPGLSETDFHAQLAELVRSYLAIRFGMPALQRTSTELIKDLQEKGLIGLEQESVIREILERCDRGRFAPPQRSNSLHGDIIQAVRQLLTQQQDLQKGASPSP